jgi:predicted nuclease of predicted toxin-antitoxin system
VKLLVDMNLSPRWVEALNAAGFEATHWSNIGAGNAPDEEILGYAAVNNLILLTHDLDFGAILAVTNGLKPSVVQIRSGQIVPELDARYVIDALRQMASELSSGALLTIDPHRMRVRILPLSRA